MICFWCKVDTDGDHLCQELMETMTRLKKDRTPVLVMEERQYIIERAKQVKQMAQKGLDKDGDR